MKDQFNVLIVDDDLGDVELIQEFLNYEQNEQIQLNIASDGVEAINYLNSLMDSTRQSMPDLIILDLNMPRKNGRQVLNELKNQNIFKTIPVVVFTTSDTPDDIRDVYNLGGNAYVTKPAGLEKFEEVVTSIKHFWIKTNKQPIVINPVS